MTITEQEWNRYIGTLRKLSDTVADKVRTYVDRHGIENTKELIDYSYALVSQYGEGAAALSAQMYDVVAEIEGRFLAPAEVAPTASYGEVAKSVNGTLKKSTNSNEIAGAVSRWVKMAGSDTTLQNSIRDGAEFAWVPRGDTCPFCLALASRGWQRASKKILKNGHAEHIHANCDCQYAVRFDSKSNVAGYDPDKYKEMYYDADGATPNERINAMRRQQYAQNKDMINAQKRAAYAKRKDISMKLSDNEGAFHTVDERRNEDKKSIIKPRNIIKNLESTEVGKEAISLIENNNTLVELCYGRDNIDPHGNIIMGYYNPFNNKISVFVDSTKTVAETAKTVVHEAFHISDYGMCQKSEVYCMMKEMQHEKGGKMLTAEEKKGIIQLVRKLYPQLPWEV